MTRLTEDTAPARVSRARTLVVPTVSAANVPQLAVDLLLHTHGVTRVACVVDPAVLPAVGADALGTGAHSLSTACELFCDDGDVAVLQLRAPLVPGTGPAFVRRVHAWARRFLNGGHGACVVWLHSSHAEEVGGGGPLQPHLGPTGADIEYALARSEPSVGLAAALGRLGWSAVPTDDPRREAGHVVHGVLDAAADSTDDALEVVVLSSTVAEWSAVQDGATLATALTTLLAELAAADGAGGGPAGAARKTALNDWRQPPSWTGLLL
ncbi:hypothetical protein KFE25_000788 [Diacronema lutheri]|uniref:Proteasome assembly chaperone 2 n=1 Tax=Diacronema lutheri TaxID=2081491 RepID=A0A8J5XS47_DIALT|nr:hypothetical protein KFE25_000788 [Diacronema lutheri]